MPTRTQEDKDKISSSASAATEGTRDRDKRRATLSKQMGVGVFTAGPNKGSRIIARKDPNSSRGKVIRAPTNMGFKPQKQSI